VRQHLALAPSHPPDSRLRPVARPPTPVEALVADACFPAALAGIRLLGDAGVVVVALDRSRLAGGCWSRAAGGRGRVPDPAVDPAGFGGRVGELSREHGDPPVFAATEATIDALLDRGLGRAFAAGAVLGRLRAKAGLEGLLRGSGLRAPRTLALTTAAGLGELELDGEVVIKAANPAGTLRGIQLAADRAGLRALGGRLPGEMQLIVQERVAGPQLSLAVVLTRDGELLGAFQHAVERTWPLAGGTTSLARSEPADPALVEAVAGILRRAGFWGLAQLDLVGGGGVDRPVVLDVNTRFYGSMALAGACGVNLPAAWHAAAVERPRAEPASYRCGLRFWWAEGDIRTLHRLCRPRGDHVGPLRQRGDQVAGALVQASSLVAEARARLR
jgi:hypothetical protein